jgi:hypothetical protein
MARNDPRLSAFLARCDSVAHLLRLKRSTLSTRLFNDGKRLDQIATGGDIGIRSLAGAEDRLAELEGGRGRSHQASAA